MSAAAQLLAVVESMLRELRGGEAPTVALDDDLERTLGIDSLTRMELMLRLEQSFGVRMPQAMVQEAHTPTGAPSRGVAAAKARIKSRGV